MSEETKRKISQSEKGKKVSIETRKKLHEVNKYKRFDKEVVLARAIKQQKKIACYDTNDLINAKFTFDSLKSAQEILGVNYRCISMCCHGKRKTAGGFVWKFM